jgi:arylsulfatase A-like enzyme
MIWRCLHVLPICALLAFGSLLLAETPSHPNVLIILTDDQGFGDLGCHGNTHIKTPRLDRLYRESTRLTQFYSQPVCTPTRACLMTGRYHYRTRAFDTLDGRAMMDPAEVTIAETFSAAGYRTGIFGKWHLGDNYPTRAIDQGFQEALILRGGGIGQHSDLPGSTYSSPVLWHNGAATKLKGYCTDLFVNAAIEFVEQNRDRPFLAYLATNVPHDPLQVPPEYSKPFEAAGIDSETAAVYGMLKNLDDNLGRLFARMDELKLSEKTIVLFMSDNGPAMAKNGHALRYNANLRGEKKETYEGGIRVPCFIRWPGHFGADREINRIAGGIDLLPTLSELCNVPLPQGISLDGVSLAPLLRGGANVVWPDRALHFQWHRGNAPILYRNCASRTQQYKLINGTELYDMGADPGERTDVAAAHRDVVEKLRGDYEMWLADVSGTRGFDPPLIVLGTEHENPAILSSNDWRRDDPDSKLLLGYWKVFISRAGKYVLTVRPYDEHSKAASIQVRVNGFERTIEPNEQREEYRLEPMELAEGPAKLEAWVARDGKPVKGIRLVTIERLQ